ncbi:MAG TPA: AzlD domain-containing protein [Magnetospirillaceae bacterium]|jgi:branched-subunit amino acid transport protein
MSTELIMVLGMSAVTMIPRALPALFAGRWQPPRKVRQWLDAVPYAALGALVFPGIITSDITHWQAGAAAGVASLVAALLRAPAFICGAVAVGAAIVVRLIS